jgi:hypothetical protein
MSQILNVDEVRLIKEGTILMTRRNPKDGFFMDRVLKFVHLAIAVIENGETYIFDLHPDNKNNEYGSLQKRSLKDYMVGKKLVGIYHTGASTERIQAVANKCWKGKYKTWHFNCQQFIDDVTHKEIRSDLYSYYTVIIILLAVAGVAIIGGTIYVLASGIGKGKK